MKNPNTLVTFVMAAIMTFIISTINIDKQTAQENPIFLETNSTGLPPPSPTSTQINTATSDDQAETEIPIATETPIRNGKPTPTPLIIPPPQGLQETSLMIGFAAIAAVVVLIGVWINIARKKSSK